jgi:hypothetical protein
MFWWWLLLFTVAGATSIDTFQPRDLEVCCGWFFTTPEMGFACGCSMCPREYQDMQQIFKEILKPLPSVMRVDH